MPAELHTTRLTRCGITGLRGKEIAWVSSGAQAINRVYKAGNIKKGGADHEKTIRNSEDCWKCNSSSLLIMVL